MPQHKSCEKRIKQDVKRTARNRAERGNLRTAVRAFRELETAARAGKYSEMQSILDRAVKKGIISRNRAARLKSRLSPKKAA
jgi:small subunit ribosomal protein S20